MIQLDEAHAAFGQAAGQQAVRGEGAVAGLLHAVHFERLPRFLAEIGELRHAGLHLEGHFVLAIRVAISGSSVLLGQHAVEPLDFIHDLPLRDWQTPSGLPT